MWLCYLCDASTGELGAQIDIPSFSWDMTVSDSSFTTTKDKGTGEGEASSVTVPWACLPGTTPQERGQELESGVQGMVLCWEQDDEVTPILYGVIGDRTDTYADTSFDLDSVQTVLEDRYILDEDALLADGWNEAGNDWALQEGGGGRAALYGGQLIDSATWGTAVDGASLYASEVFPAGEVSFEGMTRRGIVATAGEMVTSGKRNGALPIDWQYVGEEGAYSAVLDTSDIDSLRFGEVMDSILDLTVDASEGFDYDADTSAGILQGLNIISPDMTFRPCFMDEDPGTGEAFSAPRVYMQFVAGTDEDVYISQDRLWYLSAYDDLEVQHCSGTTGQIVHAETGEGEPINVYLSWDVDALGGAPLREESLSASTTGAAFDEAFGEDALVGQVYETQTDEDDDEVEVAVLDEVGDGRSDASQQAVYTAGVLYDVQGAAYYVLPQAQVTLTVNATDLPLGQMWPGDVIRVPIDDFPTLPDGDYDMRLMEMQGDETGRVTLTFDVMNDPAYELPELDLGLE